MWKKGEPFVTYILLYGEVFFQDKVNFLILNASLDFVLSCPVRTWAPNLLKLKFNLLSVYSIIMNYTQPVKILKISCLDF